MQANGYSSKLSFIERWSVVLIALGVAIHQFVATETTALSPWKGGGFGMFASTDSPGTRFVRAEGITTDGQRIRIDAFDGLERNIKRRWRSRPLEAQLESLADDLMQREFVRTNLRSVAAISKLQREVPLLGETLKLTADDKRNMIRFHRPKREDDPELEEGKVRRLQAIQLQWWHLEFDAKSRQIRSVPLFPKITRGPWTTIK